LPTTATSMGKKLLTPAEKVATKETIQIGAKMPGIFKQGKNYLYEKVAKPASEIISGGFKKNPEFMKKLGVTNDTIKLVKKYGYDKVANFGELEEQAKKAFEKAMSQKTGVYGDKINIANTLDKMESAYNKIKDVDPGNKIKQIIDTLGELRPAAKGFYADILPTPTQVTRQMRGEPLTEIGREVRITRAQLSNVRDQLNNLYKERAFDKSVFDIIDSLYADAEKSGLKGINNARRLFKEAKEFEKVSKNLAKVEKLDANKILSDIEVVYGDPKRYQAMIDKYSNYVGKDKAKKIFDEAISARRGKSALTWGAGATGAGLAGSKILDMFK